MRSNCLLVACALWWRRGGRGKVNWRKSDYGWFPHFLYAEKQKRGFRLVSYVPLNPKHKLIPPPLFRGRMKWGDIRTSMTPTPPKPEQWHIKREVQIGHLITTMSVAFSVIWYAGKLEQRIALVEQSVTMQRDRDTAQDNQSAAAYSQMHQQLDRIDAKLDRLIEARGLKP